MTDDAVEVRILVPRDEKHVAALLATHADSSLFLRRNLLNGLVDRDAPYHGTWAGAFEDGRLVAVAQHTRFDSVVVQAPVHHERRRARGGPGERAARARHHRSLGYMLAARTALGLDGVAMRMESHEGLYPLPLDALVVPSSLATDACRCRAARADELERLVDWRVGFNVESNAQRDRPSYARPAARRSSAGSPSAPGGCWEADGVSVAFQQFNAMLPDVVQVGGVWTPPALRGRGYGRAVVAGALLAVRPDGVRRGVLFMADDNAPARRAYDSR